MKMLKSTTGSVLMEFVIVLPIYFLLLGFAFVTGELALHSIQLAGGADRSLAHSTAAFDAFKRAASPGKDPDAEAQHLSYAGDGGGTERVSEYHSKNIEWTWNESFQGPWSKIVAATVSDYYTLTPLTRGFVAFWYRDSQKKVETLGGSVSGGSALDEMIRDSGVVGRIKSSDEKGMTGRDRHEDDVREFGYYSLVRDRQWPSGGYRSWPAGALAKNDNWQKYVADEKFLETNPTDSHSSSDLRLLSDSVLPNAPPKMEGGEPVYGVDPDLRKWKK